MALALNIPGQKNSGPQHWQTAWESKLEWLKRVEMPEWEFADRRVWVETLEKAIQEAPEPVYLISHSLGGLTIAHLPESSWQKVKGAFIVAPPDLTSFSPPPIVLETYLPVPLNRFRFPSVVVSSSDDPYCKIPVAENMAESWESAFLNIGPAGHIGSDLDGWPAGMQMFLEFVKCCEERG